MQVDRSQKMKLVFEKQLKFDDVLFQVLRMIPVNCWCLIFLLLISRAIASEVPKPTSQPTSSKSSENFKDEKDHHNVPPSDVPHSRPKRLIWVTDDGRLALPPGTSLVIAPTLAMPFVRYPPVS